jgi:ornithine cyclodeaminase
MSLTSYDPHLTKTATSEPAQLVPLEKIESCLSTLLSTSEGIDKLFASQHRAFQKSTLESKQKGLSSSLPIQTAGQIPQPTLTAGKGAQVCIKTGYVKDGETMVSKVAAGGGDDTGNTGVVFVFSQTTLRLKTVLCDEGLLTEVRTAAACAFASKLLLGRRVKDVSKIGLVGGGVQAVWQLRMLQSLNENCNRVVVKTRSKESAQAFMDRMKSSTYLPDREWEFEHYESVQNGGNGFRECQLIHTLTTSREPVLYSEDCNVGSEMDFLHITAVGADSPGKCELSHELIRKANDLYCDSKPQSMERGEFQAQEFHDKLVEIGSVESSPHEEVGRRFTIFDSSGLPLQDVEMANLISNML